MNLFWTVVKLLFVSLYMATWYKFDHSIIGVVIEIALIVITLGILSTIVFLNEKSSPRLSYIGAMIWSVTILLTSINAGRTHGWLIGLGSFALVIVGSLIVVLGVMFASRSFPTDDPEAEPIYTPFGAEN